MKTVPVRFSLSKGRKSTQIPVFEQNHGLQETRGAAFRKTMALTYVGDSTGGGDEAAGASARGASG
jgi:hypothetical protein